MRARFHQLSGGILIYMHLKNLSGSFELTSENPLEAKALFRAGQKSYCPRASGLVFNDEHRIVLKDEEAEEFVAGFIRDDSQYSKDKWSVARLIACYMAGEIKDEASAEAMHQL